MTEATAASVLESVKATNKANKDVFVVVVDTVLDDSTILGSRDASGLLQPLTHY